MCYNEFMVRSIHKINIAIVALLIGAGVFAYIEPSASADSNVPFNVDIKEALTVSISTPTSWASGNFNELLRNKVTVTALTNNNSGVTVSMYADDTKLQNTIPHNPSDATMYINTLSADTTANSFPVNKWGYSLNDTVAGSSSATYSKMKTSSDPIEVFSSTLGTQGSKDVFFGAKANSDVKSGTYAQTVYFAAVTGTLDPSVNPPAPTNPTEPTQPDATPIYYPSKGVSTGGQTNYTYRSYNGSGSSSVSGATEETSTQVSKGNNVDSYDSYVRAAGVTTTSPTTTTSNNVSTLGIALASAAGVAAASGAAFLVAAKRHKDDDEK